jgi:3-deoxy-manno-octulosonate cytidylyltransferase (CMP-KDO synthetase)
MRFTVFLPVRLNSQRLEKKALLRIKNIPLFVYTARQALKSDAQSVVVATDNQEIFETAKEFNINAIMTSESHQSGTDRIKEAATLLRLGSNDLVINVQGDEPLIEPSLINKLAELLTKSEAEFVSACSEFTNYHEYSNPNNVKVILDSNNFAITFSRSMIGNMTSENFKKDIVYHHHGIYGYTIKFLDWFCNQPLPQIECFEKLEQLRAIYNRRKVSMYISDFKNQIGVDTEDDFFEVSKIIENS